MPGSAFRQFCLFVFFLASSLLICPAFYAEAGHGFSSARDLVSAVTRKAAEARSLECSVYQEKHLSMLAKPVVFTGRMSVQRPDRLRWEFVYPIPSVFIINGSRVFRCTPSSRPVEFDINSVPAMKQAIDQMLAWVSGDFQSLSGMFSITLAPVGTGLIMVPEVQGQAVGITKITVMFDPVSLRPSTVRIDEQGGDWTRILLSDYRINPDLPASTFKECGH